MINPMRPDPDPMEPYRHAGAEKEGAAAKISGGEEVAGKESDNSKSTTLGKVTIWNKVGQFASNKCQKMSDQCQRIINFFKDLINNERQTVEPAKKAIAEPEPEPEILLDKCINVLIDKGINNSEDGRLNEELDKIVKQKPEILNQLEVESNRAIVQLQISKEEGTANEAEEAALPIAELIVNYCASRRAQTLSEPQTASPVQLTETPEGGKHKDSPKIHSTESQTKSDPPPNPPTKSISRG